MFLNLLIITIPTTEHPFSNLSNLCEILITDKKHFIWYQIFGTVYRFPWKQLTTLTPTNTRQKSIFLTEWKIMKVIYIYIYIYISNYYFVISYYYHYHYLCYCYYYYYHYYYYYLLLLLLLLLLLFLLLLLLLSFLLLFALVIIIVFIIVATTNTFIIEQAFFKIRTPIPLVFVFIFVFWRDQKLLSFFVIPAITPHVLFSSLIKNF